MFKIIFTAISIFILTGCFEANNKIFAVDQAVKITHKDSFQFPITYGKDTFQISLKLKNNNKTYGISGHTRYKEAEFFKLDEFPGLHVVQFQFSDSQADKHINNFEYAILDTSRPEFPVLKYLKSDTIEKNINNPHIIRKKVFLSPDAIVVGSEAALLEAVQWSVNKNEWLREIPIPTKTSLGTVGNNSENQPIIQSKESFEKYYDELKIENNKLKIENSHLLKEIEKMISLVAKMEKEKGSVEIGNAIKEKLAEEGVNRTLNWILGD